MTMTIEFLKTNIPYTTDQYKLLQQYLESYNCNIIFDVFSNKNLINFGMSRYFDDQHNYSHLNDKQYLKEKLDEIFFGFALTLIHYYNLHNLNQLLINTAKPILFITEHQNNIMLNGIVSVKQ